MSEVVSRIDAADEEDIDCDDEQVENAAAAAATIIVAANAKRNLKKKAKRRAKQQSATASQCQDDVSHAFHAECEVRRSSDKGVEVVARSALPPGTQILLEPGFVFVVLSEHAHQVCAVCLRSVASRSGDAAQQHGVVRCAACSLHTCCSAACARAAASRHALECAAFAVSRRLAAATDTDADLMRILVRVASRVHEQAACDEKTDDDATTFRDLWALLEHATNFSSAWVAVVSNAVRALVPLLAAPVVASLRAAARDRVSSLPEVAPPRSSPQLPVEAPSMCASTDDSETRELIVRLLAGCAMRVNINSHSLGGTGGGGVDATALDTGNVAFGLFPRTAYLNHSCAPNCYFAGTAGGRMSVRTIAPVAAGDELTVRYIDIFAPRVQRRAELRASKAFECACVRCREPLSASVDRYLTGHLCAAAACADSRDDAVLCAVVDGTGGAHDDHGGDASEWRCSRCDARTRKVDMDSREARVHAQLETARAARSRHGVERARKLLDAFLAEHADRTLHRAHALVMDALVPLLNVCRAQRDWVAVAACASRIVSAFDLIFPPNYPETADMLFVHAEALTQLCDSAQLPPAPCANFFTSARCASASACVACAHLERARLMRRCCAIRCVAFGAAHAVTRATVLAARAARLPVAVVLDSATDVHARTDANAHADTDADADETTRAESSGEWRASSPSPSGGNASVSYTTAQLFGSAPELALLPRTLVAQFLHSVVALRAQQRLAVDVTQIVP